VTAENVKPLHASAMNATVQGKTDSNPPPSFNNLNTSNNVKNNVDRQEPYASELLIQCATQLKKYYDASNEAPATNARWGIPPGLGLCGGGESSLNSGTSNWGTPSGGNSNSNNNSNSSAGGWGGSNQGQGNTTAQGQWGNSNNSSSSVNRNTGSGGSSQGPSGQQNTGEDVNSWALIPAAPSPLFKHF
jgi:trinucleotide repeat-containing gene 6 protein